MTTSFVIQANEMPELTDIGWDGTEGGALIQKKCAVRFSSSRGIHCAYLNWSDTYSRFYLDRSVFKFQQLVFFLFRKQIHGNQTWMILLRYTLNFYDFFFKYCNTETVLNMLAMRWYYSNYCIRVFFLKKLLLCTDYITQSKISLVWLVLLDLTELSWGNNTNVWQKAATSRWLWCGLLMQLQFHDLSLIDKPTSCYGWTCICIAYIFSQISPVLLR